VDVGELSLDPAPLPNEGLILRNGRKSALATFDSERKQIRHVNKIGAYGITPRNAEQAFALHALLNPDVNLVTLSGKAGTGKTLLALAAALECRKSYRQVFMARPVVPLSNKDIGYLPGDIQSKLDPYMQPLFDNLGSSVTNSALAIPNTSASANCSTRRNWSSRPWPTYAAAV
jgi:PhoH-like ATPase